MKNTSTRIEINRRFYMERPMNQILIGPGGKIGKNTFPPDSWSVYDRVNRQRRPSGWQDRKVFSNGTEQECREWVLRNCIEPEPLETQMRNLRAEAAQIAHDTGTVAMEYEAYQNMVKKLACKAEKLSENHEATIKLLREYHDAMPTEESGELLLRAEGWK